MSESVNGSEFLAGIEEYLKYLNHKSQAESIHTLSRTINSDNPKFNTIKSVMQEISGKIQKENRHVADLLHGIVKAEELTSVYKTTLQYVGKLIILNSPQDAKIISDLLHGILKAEELNSIYKAILFYVGKILEDKILADLASAISRSMDSENFEDDFIKSYLSMLDRQFLNDKIFRGINNCIKSNVDRTVINDAFSRSQIKSKIWLIEELEKINKKYDNVLVMAGWFGQLKSIYEKKLTYSAMRIVELDKSACEASDYIFNLSNLENYKVKSVYADINKLTLHKNGYEWRVENFKDNTGYSEKFLPDLIINTSAEHMTEEWFHQIRFKQLESNPIVAIQSNNLFDIPGHVNCVHSIDHMKKKFPMKEILFEGELQLKGYKRVMLIGKP